MLIQIKRIYDQVEDSEGIRILVDRLWPRGVKKEAAKLNLWAKNLAPSNELRKWYNHDHEKWKEFRRRYFAELDSNPEGIAELHSQIDGKVVIFLFTSKELKLNNAAALKEYIETQLTRGSPP